MTSGFSTVQVTELCKEVSEFSLERRLFKILNAVCQQEEKLRPKKALWKVSYWRMFSIVSDFLAFHEVFSVQGYEKKKQKEYKVLYRTPE